MTMTDLLGDVADEPVRIIRPPEHVSCEYSNQTNKFIERNVEFKNQYCKLYTVRLAGMLPFLNARIAKKWGDKYPIVQLHKLQETPNIKCIMFPHLELDSSGEIIIAMDDDEPPNHHPRGADTDPATSDKIRQIRTYATNGYHIKYTNNNTNIYIHNEHERQNIITDLNTDTDNQYYTYTNRETKTHAFVLRGLDSAPETEELRVELMAHGININ